MVPCGIFHMVVVSSATAQTTLVELAAEQGRPAVVAVLNATPAPAVRRVRLSWLRDRPRYNPSASAAVVGWAAPSRGVR